jgi:23S rRNA (uracil1939-C5)-methyltransferase
MTLPVIKPDSIFTLTIDGLAADGDGIGRFENRTVFVPRTIPGEKVRVRARHITPKKIFAEPVEILSAVPQRVKPICRVFDECGGCQLMHYSYAAQLEAKKKILLDTLASIAKIEFAPDKLEILAAKNPLCYRNRGQYPVAKMGHKVVTGFFAPRSHRVVPIDKCHIHQSDLDQAVAAVRAWARRKKISVYDENNHSGWLRHVVVRMGVASGQLLVVLVASEKRKAGFGDLVRRLRRTLPGVVGLVLNVNPAETNVILGPSNHIIWGQDRVLEKLGALRFQLSSGSFFQVNTEQAEVLFEEVCGFLDKPSKKVIDAYCGVGVMASILASRGHPTLGIEVDGQAIEDARRAAADNKLSNVEFHAGRVERILPDLLKDGLDPAAIVLDPPRKGCRPSVLEAISNCRIEKIAYVSCHPGTLARDLAYLKNRGYIIDRIKAVDMFPQTHHLETMVGLVRG